VVLDDGAQHTISRRHATIEQPRAGVWALCDNGSLNGVFLNDVRIASGMPIPLHDSDTIVFGGGGQLPAGSKLAQPFSAFVYTFRCCRSSPAPAAAAAAAAAAPAAVAVAPPPPLLLSPAPAATAPESKRQCQRNDEGTIVATMLERERAHVERLRRDLLETEGLIADMRGSKRVADTSFFVRAAEIRAGAASSAAIAEECVCPVCQDLAVEPRVVACGHVFCECCLASWVAAGVSPACPLCRVPMLTPPVPCIALANVIRRVVAMLPPEERETYWGRVDAARARAEDDAATRKLRASIAAAKLHGTRFLCITEEWSDEERAVFARGVSRYTGAARVLYCESVGLTPAWLRNAATADSLLIAAINVGIPSAQSRTPRELRELLASFIAGRTSLE